MGVGALAPSNAVANAAGSLLTLFSLLFAGYLLDVEQIDVQALQAAGAAGDLMGGAWTVMAALSPLRYAYARLYEHLGRAAYLLEDMEMHDMAVLRSLNLAQLARSRARAGRG